MRGFPKLRAFAKQKPVGDEAKIIAALDGEDAHYLAMETALLWHLTPSGFRACSEMDRVIMTTHFRERSLRQAMVSKVQHDLTTGKKDRPSGSGAHDSFFGGIGD